MTKFFILSSFLLGAIACVHGNPYGYGGYGGTIRQTALQLEGSVEIESPAGPPKPPDYEGGPRVELNVKEGYGYGGGYGHGGGYAPSYYSPPPKKYSKYHVSYKKHGPPSYYKLPSNDVPYYETTTKRYKSPSSHQAVYQAPHHHQHQHQQNYHQESPQHDYDYQPQQPLRHYIAETKYHGPSEYDDQHAYQRYEQHDNYMPESSYYNHYHHHHHHHNNDAESNYNENSNNNNNNRLFYFSTENEGQESYNRQGTNIQGEYDYYSMIDPRQQQQNNENNEQLNVGHTLNDKITQIATDSLRKIAKKDVSVLRDENYGTIINIPAAAAAAAAGAAAAASNQIQAFVIPDFFLNL